MKRILLVLATMVAAVLLASGVALAAKPPPPVIESGAFINPAPITINDATRDETTLITTVGTATPYPSTITVPVGIEPEGFPAGSRITDVGVIFSEFSHTFPDDVDMLLVGPSGESTILMSDAGGGQPGIENASLTFRQDRRFSKIPDDGPLEFSSTYRPANYRPSDTFPSPAPTAGKRANLSVFEGTDPIGTWELYIVDDEFGDAGSIPSGWILRIDAEVPPETLP